MIRTLAIILVVLLLWLALSVAPFVAMGRRSGNEQEPQ